jgi:hypothetical protein
MPALLKFLILLAIFLSASANAFTCLRPIAGSQVRVDHLIQLEGPISKQTNEPTCKPTFNPTNELSIDLWQCQMEIGEPINDQMNDLNNLKDKPLQKHYCTDLGIQSKLIFTSEKTNSCQQLTHAEESEGVTLVSLPIPGHKFEGIQLTSSHSMNNLQQCRSFFDNVSIDSWQCQMEIIEVKSKKTAQ